MAARTAPDEQFLMETIRKSLPNAERPRLATESEQKFAELETRSAECYASLEIVTHDLQKLAAQLDEEAAIPEETDACDDVSTVNHIEALRSKV